MTEGMRTPAMAVVLIGPWMARIQDGSLWSGEQCRILREAEAEPSAVWDAFKYPSAYAANQSNSHAESSVAMNLQPRLN
jgi:hypothetical protein